MVSRRALSRVVVVFVLAQLSAAGPLLGHSPAERQQPYLRFSGHQVRIDNHFGGERHYGMHVDSVRRGSAA